jgi:hypothetical protein
MGYQRSLSSTILCRILVAMLRGLANFRPVLRVLKYVAEVLLWLFYRLGLCCGVVGQFAMYMGGKVTSHPNLITIHTAYHPQKLYHEIAVLLQINHTPAFRLKV